jgi:hypothetical protein
MVGNETMTDVNIAVELMQDAFHNNFDTALLVSADSDLVGPVVAVQKLLPQKARHRRMPAEPIFREPLQCGKRAS